MKFVLLSSMFTFHLINTPESFDIDLWRIELIFLRITEEVDIIQQGRLNIAFLPDAEIQALNAEYRGIDNTTDVLSFHYFDDFFSVDHDEVVGECIFSESRILSQAQEHGHPPREEFEILLIHSILHILGYDHEIDEEYEEMWRHEKTIRNTLSLSM